MSKFIPRTVFPKLDSIPKSYFLGHHRAGLEDMKSRLGLVDVVIECRDFRAPLTSVNPLLEEAVSDKRRVIVYTKRDLGGDMKLANQHKEAIISQWGKPFKSFFTNSSDRNTLHPLLRYLRRSVKLLGGVAGTRVLVVGMPNVGKSSLLNALRSTSLRGRGKAAKTGDQPGVTRKIGTEVKIIEKAKDIHGVYVLDTPGVFVPYVPDSESMLKLALCGTIKSNLIPPTTLADYLLFHMNLNRPFCYRKYAEPTNDIMALLTQVALISGKVAKGGVPDTDAAARWLIQRWRTGYLPGFIMDDVRLTAMEERKAHLGILGGSINQAKKAEKIVKRDASAHRAEATYSQSKIAKL